MEGWGLSIGAEFNQGTGNGTAVMFRVTPPGATPTFRSTRGPIETRLRRFVNLARRRSR